MTLTQQTQEKINLGKFDAFSEAEFDIIYDSINRSIVGPEAVVLTHDFLLKLITDSDYRTSNALPPLGKIKNLVLTLDTKPEYYAMYIKLLIDGHDSRATGNILNFFKNRKKYLGAVIDVGVLNSENVRYIQVEKDFKDVITSEQYKVLEELVSHLPDDKLGYVDKWMLGNMLTFDEVIEAGNNNGFSYIGENLINKWIMGAPSDKMSAVVDTVTSGTFHYDFYNVASGMFKYAEITSPDKIRLIHAHNRKDVDLTSASMLGMTTEILRDMTRAPTKDNMAGILTNLLLSDASIASIDNYAQKILPTITTQPVFLGADIPRKFFTEEDILKYPWFFSPQALSAMNRSYVTKSTFKILNALWKPTVGKTRRWNDKLIDFESIIRANMSMSIDDVEYLQERTGGTNKVIYDMLLTGNLILKDNAINDLILYGETK